MTQQYQTRMQRFIIFFTLIALVVVVAKNVVAGTKYVVVKSEKTVQCDGSNVRQNAIISLASEIQDLPWSPMLNFFR